MNESPAEPVLDGAALAGLGRGVEEFNSGRFFECHDTLEEVWQGIRGAARDFFQGLIQVSVGFYHLSNGNLRGAESQLAKGLQKLEAYGPSYAGIELAGLREEIRVWLKRIEAGEPLRGTVADLPKYRYTPPN